MKWGIKETVEIQLALPGNTNIGEIWGKVILLLRATFNGDWMIFGEVIESDIQVGLFDELLQCGGKAWIFHLFGVTFWSP